MPVYDVLYIEVKYNTVQWNAIQCNEEQCISVYIAVKYNTVQWNAIKCNEEQYRCSVYQAMCFNPPNPSGYVCVREFADLAK